MKQIKVLLLVFLLAGCDSDKEKEKFGLQRDYIEQQAHGDEKSFIHYLSLSGVEDENSNFTFVLKNVKNYFDTCSIKKPIRAICIIRKSKKHKFETGEPDYSEVYKDALFELYFDNKNSISSFSIEKFTFFENGKHKEINMAELNALMSGK